MVKEKSFIFMWQNGWCKDCDFEANKCAERHICEAYRDDIEYSEEKINKIMEERDEKII